MPPTLQAVFGRAAVQGSEPIQRRSSIEADGLPSGVLRGVTCGPAVVGGDDDTRSLAAASGAPSTVVVPDPMPMKAIPRHVLTEEDYTCAVSSLIERDFFPDLPHLRARLDLYRATEVGDEERARELRWELANMHRATPRPSAAATPQVRAPPEIGASFL